MMLRKLCYWFANLVKINQRQERRKKKKKKIVCCLTVTSTVSEKGKKRKQELTTGQGGRLTGCCSKPVSLATSSDVPIRARQVLNIMTLP